jgi:hypothetical protein
MSAASLDLAALPALDDAAVRPMELPTFLRLFQLRKAQIMWLLGAGASRAAGIKTAGDMIWEFKQKLYCSEKKVPLSFIADPGDPIVQRKMQAHFDRQSKFPVFGAEDEYSAYFDATYPSPRDRRAYIDSQVQLGRPSYGHFALALLMREGFCHAVWTTNFDHTIEDAAFKILGSTGKIVVADLGEPRKFAQAWSESRWPIYGKLHGDYHSEKLKNTQAELRKQDEDMRRSLVEACRGKGLAVTGYSGRDASVMAALTEAIDSGRGYPGGLFWFKRSGELPYSAVTELIAQARAAGIEAHLIEVETFDELLSDIVRFLPETAQAAQTIQDAARPRLSKAVLRVARATTPAIRTNAMPISSYPAACRLIACDIGGWEDIRAAIAASQADILAQRCQLGVLAFGRDVDVRRTFEPHNVTEFGIHPITAARLVKPTGERNLIGEALFRAIGRRPGLRVERRGVDVLVFPDLNVVKTSHFQVGDTKPLDMVAGTLRSGIRWTEACSLRIDYRLDRLWLLLEPVVKRSEITEDTPSDAIEQSREFVRQRLANRHNKQANAVIDGWSRLIAGPDKSLRIRTFDISDGYDGDFEITHISAFSGRA